MKFPFWSDPNSLIEIIEPTQEAMKKYGFNNGHDIIKLSKEHLEALINGKMLAWDDSEYSTFLILNRDEHNRWKKIRK